MTWVSDRSGMASSGTLRTAQTAPTIAAMTRIKIKNLLRAENSMTFSTTPPWRRAGCSLDEGAELLAMVMLFSSDLLERTLETAF